MKKIIVSSLLAVFLLSSSMFVANAFALNKSIAFVDVNELMMESEPGELAQKHLEEAKAILQGALDQVIAINEKKAKSLKGDEAKNFNPQAEIQRAQGLLQHQFQAHINEVQARMNVLIQEASEKWLKRNSDYAAVMPKNAAFAVNKKADVTSKVMNYLDDLEIELPELPKVVVEENKK